MKRRSKRRLILSNYEAGDILEITPSRATGLDKEAWRRAIPAGRAWSARCVRTDRVIACMGVWNDDGRTRAWALVDKDAGRRQWGELLVIARTILARCGAVVATAGDEAMARTLERVGFVGGRGDFPCEYRRPA